MLLELFLSLLYLRHKTRAFFSYFLRFTPASSACFFLLLSLKAEYDTGCGGIGETGGGRIGEEVSMAVDCQGVV